ncbi:hypothetical protein ASPZODRAFT_144799 [Penicilliopsis zonata CBS 506.65]|uniref:beta-N-acetylhexosaminidase n=1 Tax=Penicilliopsis zonata CBS 506.65 TaxID=1073090 RepID=A0A1L9SAK5_9EURO|nr:hypothetical protein ASPZODRAFT_144799 [Penicilliopsis zonata CBS 506.65]OJJ44225.1 hypothetical protein ASPZODRAFT_144799 [Penicilliopsis zonata CBS 506.65]
MRLYIFGLVLLGLDLVSARLVGVPTIPFEETGGEYPLSQLKEIIVDTRYAHDVDADGETLIPPTLDQFSRTFQGDLFSSLGVDLPLGYNIMPSADSIFITVRNSTGFHDAAGRWTSEGYELEINDDGIIIYGASPLGAWWGTRSLIQMAVLGDTTLPVGSGVDAPGWGTRGVMLDVGRHYYPPGFIVEMCSYLSFFKQNLFHLHLSDNIDNNVDLYTREESLSLYAAFRPWSDNPAVAGLNRRPNESYTLSEFDDMQRQCASRGVTILPEIESPGHALVIVQWKPELGLADLSMLNISYPETIPTVKTIWETFLPWFHSKTVHIGADEYESGLVDDYTMLVNEMNDYIRTESGKNMRIWGTFTPEEGANVSTEVSIQHWEFFEDNPYWDYIMNGYEVLNSDDAFYIVDGWSGSYPQILNKTRVFYGAPDGGPYAPNIFDTSNATNNPPRDNPFVLGHVAATWNDYGPNSSAVLNAYYGWRDVLPALGDKQWGGNLLEDEYDSIFETLHAVIPGQNLDRWIASESKDTILSYQFSSGKTDVVKDESGNGYDGLLHGCTVTNSVLNLADGCYVETPLGSKGRNYTLSFSVKPTSTTPGTLFSGPDSALLNGNGTISNVTLVTGGNPYSLNYSLPLNTWTDVQLIGRGNQTFLGVSSPSNGTVSTMEFLARLGDDGTLLVWTSIGIEAPLARIGEGFTGLMKDIVLSG